MRFYRRARKAFMPMLAAMLAVALLLYFQRAGIALSGLEPVVLQLLIGFFASLGVYRVPNDKE